MRKVIQISLVGAVLCFFVAGCREKKVDFSADVKPILNKRCISCHGGVKRNADFSLLFRHEALDTTESGKVAIIPGDPHNSEMIRRITSSDPEVRMPYKEEPLTAEEIEILTTWIEEGAEWGDHWAYQPPSKVVVPKEEFASEAWPQTDIDYFILKKLKAEDLVPSNRADKSTLLRRVYMDIIGLPPTAEQAKAFLLDESPQAFEKVVDQLLASDHFGEKWASWWLDMARYADTKGYEKDGGRTIWRYRDWVIKAFNSDMPFDQFTIEQLAGDLLPNPTDDQIIATAFHRNTMNNDEGGTDDEEFRVASLIDRVNTTYEVWQSTTMGCVQCHTHPYDPFVHEEYYKSMAFFNNTRDEDTPGEHPNLRIYEPEDQKKIDDIRKWVESSAGREEANKVNKFLRTLEPKHHPHDFDEFVKGALVDNKWLGVQPGGSARIKQINLTGKSTMLMNYSSWHQGGSFEVRVDNLNGDIITSGNILKTDRVASFSLKPTAGVHDLYFIFRNPSIAPEPAVCLVEWLAFLDDLPAAGSQQQANYMKTFLDLINMPLEDMPVMVENTPDQFRTTHIFERGNWMVQGDKVDPKTPDILNAFPEGEQRNRLGFAKWLVNENNPLTARSVVNRFWEQIFGLGIVETLEDFGTQGASPTHPELLDWLALRFVNEHKWSVKKLIKELVMSAAYQQDSRVSDELKEKDPSNRFLARGPRIRLTAEQIRDQVLATSGLLSKKMYGKSVMPYQPEGVWNSVYSGEKWILSEGEDRYRRSVYTYIKRTSLYPSMMMFDGSTREVCVSRRIRTNTPLQALATLNDSSFIVAARSFASNMMQNGTTPQEQIKAGYKKLMIRDLPPKKLDVLYGLYQDALKEFGSNEDAVFKLTADKSKAKQLAAMTVVANAMLNLDEVLTKE